MILFNRLIRIDLVFLTGLISLFMIRAGGLRDAVFGFTAALFVISIGQHIKHFKLYKKFY